MRAIFATLGMIVILAPVAVGAGVVRPTQARPPHSEPPGAIKVAAVCFKTGESSSGMTKICYYDCLGSPAAITVSAVELCPMSINR